jgi:hypothetical protein
MLPNVRSFLMLGFGKDVVNPAGVSRGLATEVYHRHAATLYGQALLILGDEGMAEQVARDVIVDECARPPTAPQDAADASRRLAVSVLRRCQGLRADQARRDRFPRQRRGSVRAGSPGVVHSSEREVLALVLFGGLEYREASRELAIPASEAAALLRAALISLANFICASLSGASAWCDYWMSGMGLGVWSGADRR